MKKTKKTTTKPTTKPTTKTTAKTTTKPKNENDKCQWKDYDFNKHKTYDNVLPSGYDKNKAIKLFNDYYLAAAEWQRKWGLGGQWPKLQWKHSKEFKDKSCEIKSNGKRGKNKPVGWVRIAPIQHKEKNNSFEIFNYVYFTQSKDTYLECLEKYMNYKKSVFKDLFPKQKKDLETAKKLKTISVCEYKDSTKELFRKMDVLHKANKLRNEYNDECLHPDCREKSEALVKKHKLHEYDVYKNQSKCNHLLVKKMDKENRFESQKKHVKKSQKKHVKLLHDQ